jgi:hypothetical protein
MRKTLKEDPTLSETWDDLIEKYQNLASLPPRDSISRPAPRDSYYYKLIEPAYQQAIAANPNNASLHAKYAKFLILECCSGPARKMADDDFNKILKQINLALALDPGQQTAAFVVSGLVYKRPGLTFTPPATVPPTPTPAISATPTMTPFELDIPRSSSNVQIVKVTVVQTRIVTATPANTVAPSPTLHPSSTPTLTAVPPTQSAPISNWLIWPLLVLVGFVGGVLVMRRKKV